MHEQLRKRQSVSAALAARVRDEIHSGALPTGTHLTAQGLGDRFGVSRSPVSEALRILLSEHLVSHEANKGYFVSLQTAGAAAPATAVRTPPNAIEAAYFALAEDRLEAKVPDVVSVTYLRERYRLSSSEVQALCTRIVKEGWLERRAGYGFQFTDMLNTADALVQTYRFRMALEPAALQEPGYSLDREGAKEARRIEERIIGGEVETMTTEELYERGVKFHELIVSGSKNPFYLDALRRINSIRRLLAYRSLASRERYFSQAQDHLEILDLLESGRNEEAAWKLRSHLGHVIHNLAAIRPILEPHTK
jgi:DNA-binding GntR family transcriptional regulator